MSMNRVFTSGSDEMSYANILCQLRQAALEQSKLIISYRLYSTITRWIRVGKLSPEIEMCIVGIIGKFGAMTIG
jgi:hypothetical protein